MSLQHRIENNFEPEVIHQSDIKQYEFLVSTTAQSDISTLVNYKLQANYAGSDLGIDLYDAYLWGKYKFQKLVLSTDLDASSRVALTSSAWSLVSDLSLSINGTRVELIENPGYAMDIISKCKNSYDWFVDNSDQMQFWPPSFANDLTTAVPAVNATNANWLAHATAPSTSKYFALKLRDVLGFCNTSKILPSCNIELTMNRNTN